MFRLPLLGTVLLLLGLSLQAAPPEDRIVVMISVDGLAHYYFDDPQAEMPNIRRLAQEGARAQRMTPSMPSVTWPNHTSLVTGVTPAKHGVVGNAYFDREQAKVIQLIGDPNFNKEEIVKVPTIYDAAKAAGLTTAGVNWPATRGATTLDWGTPDVPTNALFQKYAIGSLLEELKAAGIPYEQHQEMKKKSPEGTESDALNVQIFNFILHTHRPQLALLHISALDHTEHGKGPQTPKAYEVCKYEDELVGQVWALLQKEFAGKATLLVVSDHGFFPYRRQLQPTVLLREAGLGGQVRSMGQGGSAFLYVLDQANRPALMQQLGALFAQQEGVSKVLSTVEDFQAYGLADPVADPHSPDMVVCAKSGYAMTDSLAGNLVLTPEFEESKGTHGYDIFEPGMGATFVAAGVGIKPGSKLGTISNTSVAPTLARLLGLSLPTADGQPLETILAP